MITKMDQIEHKFIQVNGLNHHVAQIGDQSSPAVLFLHGFPEVWYSWRHQMLAVASAGFRAVAPDYRGYGLSDPPPQPDKASFADFVADVVGILDALSISKAFVVAKDFGSRVQNLLALLHPDKVLGVISLGIPFLPPVPTDQIQSLLPEGCYASRWQKPGRAEADFARFDNKTVLRNIYILFSRSEIPIANENQEIMDMVDSSTPLPSWFTEEDLAAYGSLYEKSGFQTALKVPYRSLSEVVNVAEMKINVPGLLIMGEKDYVLKFPGIEDFVRNELGKMLVPESETVYLPEGSHFVQEQLPDQVNELILTFLNNHK